MERRVKKNIKKHLLFYITFAFAELVGLYATLITAYDSRLQMTVVVIMSIFYLMYGLSHEYIHHTLHSKIVVEYVLMTSIGIGVSYFVLR